MRYNVTLIPAYGRDYKSARAVKVDWYAGKDFVIAQYGNRWDGKPINKAQADAEDWGVCIRFNSLRSFTIIPAHAAPLADRTSRRQLSPALQCGERLCRVETRSKSGYCTRHNNAVWRRIRARRAEGK